MDHLSAFPNRLRPYSGLRALTESAVVSLNLTTNTSMETSPCLEYHWPHCVYKFSEQSTATQREHDYHNHYVL